MRHAIREITLLHEIDAWDRDIEQIIEAAGLRTHCRAYLAFRATAATILAESGPDIKQFSSAAHVSNWLGLAPEQQRKAPGNENAPR